MPGWSTSIDELLHCSRDLGLLATDKCITASSRACRGLRQPATALSSSGGCSRAQCDRTDLFPAALHVLSSDTVHCFESMLQRVSHSASGSRCASQHQSYSSSYKWSSNDVRKHSRPALLWLKVCCTVLCSKPCNARVHDMPLPA